MLAFFKRIFIYACFWCVSTVNSVS